MLDPLKSESPALEDGEFFDFCTVTRVRPVADLGGVVLPLPERLAAGDVANVSVLSHDDLLPGERTRRNLHLAEGFVMVEWPDGTRAAIRPPESREAAEQPGQLAFAYRIARAARDLRAHRVRPHAGGAS